MREKYFSILRNFSPNSIYNIIQKIPFNTFPVLFKAITRLCQLNVSLFQVAEN